MKTPICLVPSLLAIGILVGGCNRKVEVVLPDLAAKKKREPVVVKTIAGDEPGRLGLTRAEIEAIWDGAEEPEDGGGNETFCEARVVHFTSSGLYLAAHYWQGGKLGKVWISNAGDNRAKLTDKSARAYLLTVGGGSWEVLDGGFGTNYRRTDGKAVATLALDTLTIEAVGFAEYEQSNRDAAMTDRAGTL